MVDFWRGAGVARGGAGGGGRGGHNRHASFKFEKDGRLYLLKRASGAPESIADEKRKSAQGGA